MPRRWATVDTTKRARPAPLLSIVSAIALVAAACGDGSTATSPPPPADLTAVRLQLQWSTQAQFAGYLAALDQGFYADEGLDVSILEGALDIVPQEVVASGAAEFGLAWVPKALFFNEEGTNLVDIGQVFQRSGTLEVSWADSGITSPGDWNGKRIGSWGFGNEYELTAAIEKYGVTVGTIVQQPPDMSLLFDREIDAAQAMTYNEYAQLLEAVDPATGRLYRPEDLDVIDFNDLGTAMLQDAVWVNADWLARAGNEDIALRFLRASFRGWIFCRDHFDACVQIVLDHGPSLGRSHQEWQLNEINKLIWPSPAGIGVMDPARWEQTIEVATGQGIIQAPPPIGAYRSDLADRAVTDLAAEGLDTTGLGFTPRQVRLKANGD